MKESKGRLGSGNGRFNPLFLASRIGVVVSLLALAASLSSLTAPAQTCAAPPLGIVSWWPGQSNTLDIIGGNNGLLLGNITYAPGEVGTAFASDGQGSAVSIGNPASLQLQNFTIEAWIQRSSSNLATSSGGGAGLVFSYGANGYGVGILDNGSPFLTMVGVDSVMAAPSVLGMGFHHLAITKNGTSVVIYVDGAVVLATTDGDTFSFGTSAAIGARGDNFGQSFLGEIDELSIYNRALAAAEIQYIYNARSAGKCAGPTAPAIIQIQPGIHTVIPGNPVNLLVVAAGTPPLNYFWQFNTTNLSGATNASLTLTNAQFTNSGNYQVVVSNASGSVTSAPYALTVATPVSCAAPATNIVSWWPGQSNTFDIIGTNNGVLEGNMTYAPGEVGTGFDSDGNNSAVSVGNPANLQLQNFTIEAWIKRANTNTATADGGGAGLIFSYGSGGYGLGILDDGTPFLVAINTASVRGGQAIDDTLFHHLAVTKNGTTAVFYVDGVATLTTTFTANFTFGTGAAIGGRGDNFGLSFEGVIDEVSVYSGALSAAQMQSIYAAGRLGKCYVPFAPSITSFLPASNQTVFPLTTITFSVTALGTPPLNYAWQLNGANLNGATNSSFLLENIQTNNAGNYRVVVSNVAGSVTSAPTTVTLMLPTTCAAPPTGLVAWWRGESNAVDSISGINGTLEGNLTYDPGMVGTAFSSDGNGSAVLLGTPAALQLQNFTVEGWIRRSDPTVATASGGGAGLILAYGPGGYAIGMLNDGTPFLNQADNPTVATGTLITDTNFHHLAVTKNGATVTVYVDGVGTVDSDYPNVFTFGSPVAIGANGNDLSDSFLGEIDELSFYNRALATPEIQSIFDAGSFGKCTGQTAPAIIGIQPASQSAMPGNTITINALVGGTPPFTYAWRFNGTNISGATSALLTLTDVQYTSRGNYTVVVGNSSGSVTSAPSFLTVSEPANCTPPPAGIVAWWQGQGTADIVSGINGVLQGNMTFGAGEVGESFNSDGNGSALLIGNPAVLQLQTFTIECWFKRSNPGAASGAGGAGLFFGYGAGGYGAGITDSGTPFLTQLGVASVLGSQGITDASNFHHFAVTKSASTVIFYLDGAATATNQFPNVFAFNTPAAVGAEGDNFSYSFLGDTDELSIYNRALQASEIQTIYQAGTNGKCSGPTPPLVTALLPAGQTVPPGSTAIISALAAGTPPLNYYWQFNGTNLSVTNPVLTLADVQPSNAGNYQVIVSNGYGSVTSTPSVLSVLFPPVFTQQPASQVVPTNSTVAFFVGVSGTEPLQYQWLFNGTNLTGQTNYLLELSHVQTNNAGTYSVVVSNTPFDAVTSAPSTLTLMLPPVITTQPVSQSSLVDSNASFSVAATSFTNLFYQWRFNTTNIAGATSATLQLANLRPGNAGVYSVVVSNVIGAVTSSNATLTLTSYVCAPAPSNLVAWWQGEGDARDAVSGSNGVLEGNVTFAAGKVGQAFAFDGIDGSAVTVPDSTNLQLQNFTIEAWIQRSNASTASASGSGLGMVFSYGADGYGMGIFDNGTPFLTATGVDDVQGGQAITDTAFHHLAVTKDGTNVIIYVDGLPTLTDAYASVFTFDTPPAIGARGDNLTSSFLGRIDELSVYSRALQASEIQAIYNAAFVGKCATPVSFVSQPRNQSILVGGNATLSVDVAGSGPVTFQWFLNGKAITGATNSSFALDGTTFFQAGNYSVTANNGTGLVALSNIVVTVQQIPILVNGSFETGDFTGWLTNNLTFEEYPLTVRPAGFNPGFGFFLTAPTDGSFAATYPFDGSGPGTISVAQDLYLPHGPAHLTFDYRAAWDMLDYDGSTLARTFGVSIQPQGGGSPLGTSNVLTAPPGTLNDDTGPLSGAMDLTAYSGRGLRISFDATVPESFTGPGFLQLDHVVLVYSIPELLSIERAGPNITVSWPASPINFNLQATSSLGAGNVWNTVDSNLMVHGITNTSVTLPLSPGATFYRLLYP